jgi:thioesterase domain-containing protein/acyl carrier protein
VPSWFVALDALPLTPSGKLDRDALPALAAASDRTAAPPRDEQELALLAIWEDLFSLRTIGVTDDFFALGGHSLLAVRLIARIERKLGIRLPLATLFQAPTIESLALLLKRRQPPSAPSCLVLLQAGGKRPFFCVHPAHGHVLCYFELSRRLPDRSFYGFQAPASLTARRRSAEAHVRIEDLAEIYLRELRGVQPEGPYLLGGWSMGGAVAYEMARQLELAGAAVALLALIDTWLPEGGHAEPRGGGQFAIGQDLAADDLDESHLLPHFARELGVPIDPLRQLAADLDSLPLEQKMASYREAAVASGALPPDMTLPVLLSLFTAFTTNVRALHRYSPAGYGGRITLLQATGSATAPGPDPGAPWRHLAARGVDLTWISGDHLSILHEPDVAALAERLDERLAQAEALPRAQRPADTGSGAGTK